MDENGRKALLGLDLGHLGEQWQGIDSPLTEDCKPGVIALEQKLTSTVRLNGISSIIANYINSNTGLDGNTIYKYIVNYCKENELKRPERDVIYALMGRLAKKGIVTRVKANKVYI